MSQGRNISSNILDLNDMFNIKIKIAEFLFDFDTIISFKKSITTSITQLLHWYRVKIKV